ncbi:hypothetical protein RSOLAG1IB_09969 [Rhizoctonia solani AG-1 IB]|uniref:Zn(2)-C6 fungal-type domain-containing protein n=1 Tax=Thanatephorus cucumeris (strain AG1-IB / isolate 7/3/14) TaxID=1108050 RepID=A0A0B7FTQ7_THACB|nr:hypothetical protein RSOLAG1IB_09969 [Rhizoctonia solani AG-1 IB]
MQYSDCLTCRARKNKCDRTDGPIGCRRCALGGIECGGYASSSALKAKHHIQHDESQTSSGTTAVTAHDYDHYPSRDLRTNEPKKVADRVDWNKLYEGSMSPHSAPRSMQDKFAIPGFPNARGQHELPRWNSNSQHHPHSFDRETSSYSAGSHEQTYGSFIQNRIWDRGESVPSAITSLLEGGFDLKLLDEDEALSHSFTIARSRTANSSSTPEEQMKSAFNPEVMENDSDDGIDTESIKAVTKGLVLDQGVDTNLFAFVLHGYVSWANQFIFEPCQTFSETKNSISLWIKQDPRLARSMSHTGLVLSRSTEYDLTDYEVLEQALVESVLQARARGSKGAEAMMAIAHSHKCITTLRLVKPFASVLSMIDLVAPVFRRACPEPDNELVNLARALTSNLNVQYYVTMDVFQSVMTHRPMRFRYNLDFASRIEEAIASDGWQAPRMMSIYGIPDRLIVTFARMNTLFEDFGTRIDPERIHEIEREIASCGPVAWSGAEIGLTRTLGKIVAHECWMLAAYIYLYMGLCGADSYEARVVKTQRAFMRVLKGVKPNRHPDSFLVLPMFILGMATNPPGQPTLLARFNGITECSQSGTMASDIKEMLLDVWMHAAGRPIRWYDLRGSCLRIVGM